MSVCRHTQQTSILISVMITCTLKAAFSLPGLGIWPCYPLPASHGSDGFLCALTSEARSTQLRQRSQLNLWTLMGFLKAPQTPVLNTGLSIQELAREREKCFFLSFLSAILGDALSFF